MMKFSTQGKSCQLLIQSPEDLDALLALDDSLWAATSAPRAAFREDAAFLSYLDPDGDGRILSCEVRTAVKWLLQQMANRSRIGEKEDFILLDYLHKDSPCAPGLLTTAAYVNEQANRSDGIVRLEDVRKVQSELRSKPLNGDGILIADAASEDKMLTEYITAAIAATGGSPDLSGKQGVSAAQLAAFHTAIADFLAWKRQGAPDNPATMPFGAETPEIYKLFAAHQQAIDRFFFLAGFVRYDAVKAAKFIDPDGSSADAAQALDAAPLARPLPDGSLPLSGASVNPLHRKTLSALGKGLFAPVLGRTEPDAISEEDWCNVKAALAPYAAYLAAKKGAIVESIPLENLEKWNASDIPDRTEKLQQQDAGVAKRVAAFSDLEKLILFHRRIPRFVNNYVSLTEFYDPNSVSLFERGRLLLDGRWFNLCMEVANPAAHAATAKNSGIFTLYVQVTPVGKPPFTVVSPATDGTRGNLAVGKRGVFFDLDGNESDAIVTSIIEAPISLREAVLAPFKNIGKMLLGKIENLSAQAQSSIEKTAELATNDAMAGKKVGTAPAPAPANNMGNLFMGVSVSVAALSSAFAFLAKSFSAMSVRARIASALAAFLMVFGPILLAGIIKLMNQEISPLLEGSGWAVNKRMGLNRRLRKQFTVRMPYPKDATGTPTRMCALVCYILLDLTLLALILWTAYSLFAR